MRRFLFFANEGEIRRSQHEDQTTQVLCLNLAANAIIAWNTVYMAEALDVLRSDGFAVDDDDLAHVPPTLWSHVNIMESTSSMLRPAPGAPDSVHSVSRLWRQ